MLSLKSLIEKQQSVWIYCENEVLQEAFLSQAEHEGFLASNGQNPSELKHLHFYILNNDMTLAYLSNMIWFKVFQTGMDNHVRIDFGRFRSGKSDFMCRATQLNRVYFSDWHKLCYSRIYNSMLSDRGLEYSIDELSYEEYQAFIYRYLLESSWHYSPNHAVELIEDNSYFISNCYLEKVPITDCAVEVGFCCG